MEENKNIEMVNEDNKLSSYHTNQRIAKYRRTAWIMIAVVIIVSVANIYWNRSFNSYEELTSTPSSEGSNMQLAVYGDGYLKFSKDGISYLDQKEKIIWTEAYTMDKPTVSIKDEYVVLADLEGNDVHLYNEQGKIGDYSMSYPIEKVLAAQQGVFCVVLNGGDSNYIRLYDKEGTLLAEIKTQIENNGYPLAVAISSDGLKLAASFYRVEGIDSQNVISFYNFGEGGKGQSGNLVGTYQFDDLLIPKVEFMDDNTVCAVGDSKTIIYQMKEKPKKIGEIEFSSEIQSVFSSEKYIGYICENTEEDFEDGRTEPYQVYIYNKKGKLVKSFERSELHESVELINNIIVNYSSGICVMEHMDGKEIFRQDMGGNIVDILPTNRTKEFIVVYGEKTSRIRLKNNIIMTNSEEEIAE